jgi:hypothetical protein
LQAVRPLRFDQHSGEISRYFDGFGDGAALRHQALSTSLKH